MYFFILNFGMDGVYSPHTQGKFAHVTSNVQCGLVCAEVISLNVCFSCQGNAI